MCAVCKKCNMARCSDVEQMQAEEARGLVTLRSQGASGPSASFQARACARELGACVRAWAARGRQGLWNVPGWLRLCHLLREGTGGGRGPGSRAICCARLPSLGAPKGSLPVVCLPLRVEFI